MFVCCTFSLFYSLGCSSCFGGLVAGSFRSDDSLIHLVDLGLVKLISLMALELEGRGERVVFDREEVRGDENILRLLKAGAFVLDAETVDLSSDCLLEIWVLAERGEVLTLAVVLGRPLSSPLLFRDHDGYDAILE